MTSGVTTALCSMFPPSPIHLVTSTVKGFFIKPNCMLNNAPLVSAWSSSLFYIAPTRFQRRIGSNVDGSFCVVSQFSWNSLSWHISKIGLPTSATCKIATTAGSHLTGVFLRIPSSTINDIPPATMTRGERSDLEDEDEELLKAVSLWPESGMMPSKDHKSQVSIQRVNDWNHTSSESLIYTNVVP